MTKYSKWDPNKVHMVNGHPVIYNKADNWASRAFKLAVATPPDDLLPEEADTARRMAAERQRRR